MMAREYLVAASMLVLVISLILFITLVVKIYRNQVYLTRIIDIFKTKDNEEISQAEE